MDIPGKKFALIAVLFVLMLSVSACDLLWKTNNGETTGETDDGILRVVLEYVDSGSPYGWSYQPNYPYMFFANAPADVIRGPDGDVIHYGALLFHNSVRFLFAVSLVDGTEPTATFHVDSNQNGDFKDDPESSYAGAGTSGTAAQLYFEIPRSDGSTEPFTLWLWTSIGFDTAFTDESPPEFNYYAYCHKSGTFNLDTDVGATKITVVAVDENFDGAYQIDEVVVDWNDNRRAETADEVPLHALRYYLGTLFTLDEIEPYADAVVFSTESFDSAPAGALDVEADLALELIVGNTPQPLEVNDIDGNPMSLDDYLGKVVLLDFWATWCGPCITELPNVQDTYSQFHDQGFEIIGVSLDNDIDTLRTFIEEQNMPWPQICDLGGWQGEIAQRYRVQSIPKPILLGKDGKIVSSYARGTTLPALVEAEIAK